MKILVSLLVLVVSSNTMLAQDDRPRGYGAIGDFEAGAVEPIRRSKQQEKGIVVKAMVDKKVKSFKSWVDQMIIREGDSNDLLDVDSLLKERQKVYTAERNRKVVISNYLDTTVKIQHIDGTLFCTLELYVQGEWVPQRCQWLSWCGNSYFYQRIPSKHQTAFLFHLPESGDKVLKARFKLLGVKEFYYSNAFDFWVKNDRVRSSKDIEDEGYDGGPYEGSVYCFKKPFNFVVVE